MTRAVKRDRHAVLLRVLKVAKRLDDSRNWVALSRLAAEHGCQTRTIQRDLRAIEASGFLPLVFSRDHDTSSPAHVKVQR